MVIFVIQPDSKRRRGWFRLQRFFQGFVLLSLWALIWLFASDHFGASVIADRAHGLFSQVDTVLRGCGLRWGCGGAHGQQIASPLYFVLLLALGKLGLQLVWWSQMIGCLAMAYALTIYTKMTCHRDWHQQNLKAPIVAGLGILVLFGFDHWLLQGIVTGTEIGLASLSVALLLRAATDAHQRHLSLWLALAILLRPEALVLCLIAPLFFTRAREPRFWWPIGASILAIALFYGAWFPGVGWAGIWGNGPTASGPGVSTPWQLLQEFPWLWLAPAALLLPQQARFARFLLLGGCLWLLVMRITHHGAAFNANAIPVLLPLVTLGWIGLFVLLGKLSTRYLFPNWAEVLLPWVAAVAALTAMAFFWHSHHLPQRKETKRQAQLKKLSAKLKEIYHRTRPIASTIPGELQQITGRPVTPIGMAALTKRTKGKKDQPTQWTLSPQPTTIISSIMQTHPWNGRPLPTPTRAIERTLLRLCRQQRINYRVSSVQISKKLYWIVFEKVGK